GGAGPARAGHTRAQRAVGAAANSVSAAAADVRALDRARSIGRTRRVGKGAQSRDRASISVVCMRAVPTRFQAGLCCRRVGTAPQASIVGVGIVPGAFAHPTLLSHKGSGRRSASSRDAELLLQAGGGGRVLETEPLARIDVVVRLLRHQRAFVEA